MLYRFGSGLVASGLVALLLKFVGMPSMRLDTAQLMPWQELPLFALPSEPDSVAEGIMRQYLKGWSTKGATEPNQGIWMQSGLTVLASHQEKVPLPAASLSKIATTLAALNRWGPNHKFETLVSATGPVKNGVLQGDLVITGSGDPFFVWEEAIALGNSLHQLGIHRVNGNLVLSGKFYMNYRDNPAIVGEMFRQGINSSTWTRGLTFQYNAMPKGTAKPKVVIAGGLKVATLPIPKQFLLLRHHSMSLAQILKEMNIYSNNELSEMLAKSVGGAQVTSQLAAKMAGVPVAEIHMVNGSGLGVENRISPRAACAMLMAVENFLQPYQLSVADIFPVSGRDQRGTMLARNIPLGSAVKTGTLNSVSALAGVMPTRDRGRVWFVIINRGGPVGVFRAQQDQLLGQLSKQWGTLPTLTAISTQAPALLGDPKRNQRVSSVQAKVQG